MVTPAPQRKERKAQRTPTGNEETAPPTARRNRTAGGVERTPPSGRPRRGDRENPPPRSENGKKGWRRGGSRGGGEWRARERQARARGTSACAALAERRTCAQQEPQRARGAATPKPWSGRAARDPRRSGGGWHKGAREKTPVGLFRARQNERPPERQRAYRGSTPRQAQSRSRGVHPPTIPPPQRGRLGGGQSTAAAVHEMSRTAQPLV